MKLIKLNPVTPGTRHQLNLQKGLLSKTNKLLKKLSFGRKNLVGKSSFTGHTTVWHKGGGRKSKYHGVSFLGMSSRSVVVCIMYDPNRNAFVSFNYDLILNKFFKNIATNSVYTGSLISSQKNSLNLAVGNRTSLNNIPIGSVVHSVTGNKSNLKPIFGRSAGTSCQLVQKSLYDYKVKIPSGRIKSVPLTSFATIGVVSNTQQNLICLGKAGRSRHMGIRPTVRGVAMNPVDHPHGGRTNGGRPSVTPWGIPTKGKKTVKNKK
jgi:large subunit ribosomal protein L2